MTADITCSLCGELNDAGAETCQGCKRDPGTETMTCPECAGEGQYEALDYGAVGPRTVSPPYRMFRCDACHGTGLVEAPLLQEHLDDLAAIGSHDAAWG